MRRRLWWALTHFDARMGEMAYFKTEILSPNWDCKIPLNVNDSDFRSEMKEPPLVQGKSSEALFAVVRSEVGDFVRRSMFRLDFTSPASQSVAIAKGTPPHPLPEENELANLEQRIEDTYLKYCDPQNPLHYMTIWTARGSLAKCRLVDHRFRYSSSSSPQAETQSDTAISYALKMLECDTNIMISPLTKGFLWLANSYFPFTAYVQIVQELKWRPTCDQADRAWEVMSDNYRVRFGVDKHGEDSPFFKIFTDIVLQAWEVREAQVKESAQPLVIPGIVSSIKHTLSQADAGQPLGSTNVDFKDFPMSMQMDFVDHGLLYDMGGQETLAAAPILSPLDGCADQLDWSAVNWNLADIPAGKGGELMKGTG